MAGKVQSSQTIRIPWEVYKQIKDECLESGETIQDVVSQAMTISTQFRDRLDDLEAEVDRLQSKMEEDEEEEEVPWYCPECQETFETERGLKIHKSKVHKD